MKERARKEKASEWAGSPSTDNDCSDNSLSDTYHMDAEEVMTMITHTSLRIPPFGGTQDENLSNFFRRFDRAVRWVVYARYPASAEGMRQKEMDMALMIQDNLVGKALEESVIFPEAAYESVQAFKDALRQAFPQPETVMASEEDQWKVKALRLYKTLFIIDPETGDSDPPELSVPPA